MTNAEASHVSTSPCPSPQLEYDGSGGGKNTRAITRAEHDLVNPFLEQRKATRTLCWPASSC